MKITRPGAGVEMSKDQGLLLEIPPLSEDPEDSLSLAF